MKCLHLTFVLFSSGIAAVALSTLRADEPAVMLAQADPQSAPAPEEPSEAERIARLQRAIDADQKALKDVQDSLNDPNSEYNSADNDFRDVDTRLTEAKKRLTELQDSGRTAEAETQQADLKKLEEEWTLARERFDLAIQARKAAQEKLVTLKTQLEQDQQALSQFTGGTAQADPGTPAPATAPAAETPAPATTPAPAEAPATPAVPIPGLPTTSPSTTPAPATSSAPAAEKPMSVELQRATEAAEKSEAAARTAEEQAKVISERMDVLRKEMDIERTLIETTRKLADNAEQSRSSLQEDYRAKLIEDPDSPEVDELYNKIQVQQQRFREAREESRAHSSRLDELQSRLASLQADQMKAVREADRTRDAAEAAHSRVSELQNPFTTRNMLQWIIDHAPRLLMIILTMALAMWFSHVAEKRIVDAMVARGGVGRRIERENRARTLVSVFQNAANVTIITSGVLMILDTIGAPITALMGGAAVFGLAIAFGAQSLIKDYFYGFMILLEQQYTINDVIRIADVSGLVERITLRVTVLRDGDGSVHFIPHGQITTTTNMTHGWSRAVFEIGVAYKEDTDQVVQCLKEIGRELRRDPKLAPHILEDLTMLGVEALGDSAIVLKFFIKTEPLKQWDVKREMLRRIKKEFEARGIEIPYPQRTIHHVYEGLAEGENDGDLNVPRRHSA